MKKILEHGYRYYMETRCPHCGCRFSYEWEDVLKDGYFHYSDNYTYTYPKYKIECPECHEVFDILNWTYHYSKDNNSNISGITISSSSVTTKLKGGTYTND